MHESISYVERSLFENAVSLSQHTNNTVLAQYLHGDALSIFDSHSLDLIT
jgi:hypothetical protein